MQSFGTGEVFHIICLCTSEIQMYSGRARFGTLQFQKPITHIDRETVFDTTPAKKPETSRAERTCQYRERELALLLDVN